MRKSPTLSVETICKKCSSISSFHRSTSKKNQLFESASAWCFNCAKETEHFIIIDKDYAYNYLMERRELNSTQQEVLELLNIYYENRKVKQIKKK